MSRLAHRYDVGGIVAVASQVRLPELEYFRTEHCPAPDLEVRAGVVGGAAPRARVTLAREGRSVTWREHLGGLVANFEVDFGDPVRLRVSPVLARSPHVVYTNLVEPLLRFLLVLRDRVLLHGATIELGGRTVTLSARTDTGKTSTVLSLLQSHPGVFFSDDMVIVAADGSLRPYPKPLTISAHTVHATPRNRLGLGARLALPAQSRLHSRMGRGVGRRLGEMNLPIMAMNAIVQALCPPPKYPVTELVDCELGTATRLEHVFVIERGPVPEVTVIPPGLAADVLLENTEDAYGFPPYASLAPCISLGHHRIQELRRREREIVSSALAGRPVLRVVASGYDWQRTIEGCIGLAASTLEPSAAAVD